MREILFRGKTKSGQWVEGAYFKEEKYYGEKSDTHIIITSKETLSNEQALDYAVVIPKTVGQYTGLTDKNGKKIFEGDIVSTDLARPYLIVEFRQGCFMYNCNDGGMDYYDTMLPITGEEQTCDTFVEIIGNVYDGEFYDSESTKV